MRHEHVELTFATVMIILGTVQFILLALKIPEHPRWSWLGGGLAFLSIGLLFA